MHRTQHVAICVKEIKKFNTSAFFKDGFGQALLLKKANRPSLYLFYGIDFQLSRTHA